MRDGGLFDSATKDRRSMTADWQLAGLRLIKDLVLKEVRHVVKENGSLLEVFRSDWKLDDLGVEQIFQVVLQPKAISAWHIHEMTTDRLFVNQGMLRIVAYDRRLESPTSGLINEFRLGLLRPALLLIPPGVCHGVQNLAEEPSSLLNIVDRAYDYQDPDHWRLPADSSQIPFCFLHGSRCTDPPHPLP